MTDEHDADAAPPPPPPAGLGARGAAFWVAVQDQYGFDAKHTERFHEVCRVLDRLEDLDAVILESGVMSVGSTGQPVTHPAVAEARQLALVLDRLLSALPFPKTPEDEAEELRFRTDRAKAGAAARHR